MLAFRRVALAIFALFALETACGVHPAGYGDTGAFDSTEAPTSGEVTDGESGSATEESSGGEGDDGGNEGSTQGPRFDVADDGPGDSCNAPEHAPCDADPDDPIRAMGLGCPGEPGAQITVNAHPSAIKTRASFGDTTAFDPREGARFAVLSTGSLEDVFAEGATPTQDECWSAYSDNSAVAGHDVYPAPPPIVFEDAGPVTCDVDPSLVGMGDCSNTLESTKSLGALRDYAEIRVDVTVPDGASSLSFNSAFLTLEYPNYWNDIFNDVYFVWLESESWTGNIAFDDKGSVISVNAAFMEYLDADASGGNAEHPKCPPNTGCSAPELQGTCMQSHGATAWLTTKVGVEPGENIQLIFGLADVGDEQLDSIAFIDNFRWGCEDGGPETFPEG